MASGRPSLSTKSLHDFKAHLQRQLEKNAALSNSSKKRTARTAVNSANRSMVDRFIVTPTHKKTKTQQSPLANDGSPNSTPLSAASPSTPLNGVSSASPPPKFNAVTATPLSFDPIDGTVLHTLNSHIHQRGASARVPGPNRIKITNHVNPKAFSYRTMSQKIVEVSDTLDVQIDVMAQLFKDTYGLADASSSSSDSASAASMGNPAAVSQSSIVAVGRIVPDSLADNSINKYSMLLEASRAVAAGTRVKLNVDQLPQFAFFPGQLVALRGSNPDGKEFIATEVLEPPLLPFATTPVESVAEFYKMQKNGPVSILVAAGPFTKSSDFEYAELRSIVGHVNSTKPDVLVLLGPFVDSTHPLFVKGEYSLSASFCDRTGVDPDNATVEDLFADKVLPILQSVAPSVTIILVSSIRDALSNHPVFPQPGYSKSALNLPQNAYCVPNPSTFSVNDITLTVSTLDSVADINKNTVISSSSSSSPSSSSLYSDRLALAYSHILSQRRIYPVLPASINPMDSDAGLGRFAGVSIDLPHLPLADISGARPDILISPTFLFTPRSVLVEDVIAINPGQAAQHSSFCEIEVVPQSHLSSTPTPHNIKDRARVDIIKI